MKDDGSIQGAKGWRVMKNGGRWGIVDVGVRMRNEGYTEVWS